MIVFRPPVRRVSIAVAFSVLIHAVILWIPHIQLSREKVQLPPLTVKLQPLPKKVAPVAAIPEVASHASKPDANALEKPLTSIVETMKEMDKSADNHLFPKHLLLTFDVYRDSGVLRVAELYHQLDILNKDYSLRAIRQNSTLSKLQDGNQFTQISQGKISEQGLRPDDYTDNKTTINSSRNLKADFDWAAQKLHFSKGGDVVLPADTQDILSFMYQLSQISLRNEIITLSVSDGAHLEKYRIEIGRVEEIITPMGNLHAHHLRKMHQLNEPYFEIWLALEYRLLPVKFRELDASGAVIEEFVISDIRASDE